MKVSVSTWQIEDVLKNIDFLDDRKVRRGVFFVEEVYTMPNERESGNHILEENQN